MNPVSKHSNSNSEIQLSMLPSGQLRSDDPPLDLVERGGVAPVPQTVLPKAPPRWSNRQLLAAATGALFVGSAVTGSLMGGIMHARRPRVPTSLSPLPQSLPFAAATLPPAPGPSTLSMSCLRPEMQVNATSSAILSMPSDSTSSAIEAPLYGSSGKPEADDIVNLVAGPTVVAYFGDAGVVRANALLALAKSDPDFIQSMITPLSAAAYSVRLYDRHEADNAYSQVNVRVDLGELNPDRLPYAATNNIWWAVILQAGAKLDAHLGLVATTGVAGDRNDHAATRRQAIESIVGAHTEVISGDQLDALRLAELSVVAPSTNLYETDREPNLNDTAALQTAAALFEAKNDNWPSLLARMGDRRNLVMVNLHAPLDLKLEALLRNNTEVQTNFFHAASQITLASGSTITISSGGAKWFSGDSFLPVTIDVPGEPTVSAYTGPGQAYSVVDREPDAVWLQRGPAIYSGWNSMGGAFKVPNDLLQLAASEITLARRPCDVDGFFKQPGLTLA